MNRSSNNGSAELETSVGSNHSDPTAEVSAPVGFENRARLAFPVVGIGASAGGLEALTTLFSSMPADSGMCFVVIQHLAPDRESLMAEILSRQTPMRVQQIEQGMQLERDNVYVIRPGFTVIVQNGIFQLGEPVERRGHRRPVDDFFRSLAEEQQEKAIALVLSGMGTNGTSGAQAIKAAGGLCLAQDPETAQFPGMPTSLIYAGYADQVLKPEDMPAVLIRYVRHPYVDADEAAREHAELELLRDRQHLNEILAILRTRSGHDFSGYKKPTVLRRIQRRLGVTFKHTLAEYAAHLRNQSEEIPALANDLMINVTGFFRDPDAWEALREGVVRPLVEGRESGSTIRAWVTACASGEEAFSLAMLLTEEAERAEKRLEIKVFATDTADKSLALARAGVYPGGIEGDISLERLDRFFDKDEHTYRVKKSVRDTVVFASQDLLRDPPFSRVDICACRNLLIYLEPEVQQRTIGLLHFALRDGGFLFLGTAETLGGAEKNFETVSKKWRIYRRIGAAQHHFVDLSALSNRALPGVRRADTVAGPLARPSPTILVQQALMDQLVAPTLVVDRHDRIVYFHGDTAPFVQPPVGEATHNLFDVVRDSLRPTVREALRRAAKESVPISLTDAPGLSDNGMGRIIITAAPLMPHGTSEYFRITFQIGAAALPLLADTAGSSLPVTVTTRLLRSDDTALEGELRVMRRELQSTIEAFEASNEELKASNEEVISINEELQSANEELESSKEELQSLNEELITVNGQLQAKINETEATTNDLTNLLGSTSIAVLFLDTRLCVRRYTPALSDLLELIPTDFGRPVSNLAQKFSGGDLVADARSVLSRLIPLESEVRSDSGLWYLRRTLPYRTADNRIDGVVVTFIDITARKQAEEALAASQSRLQAVIEQMPTAMLLVESPSGRLLFGNREAAKTFGLPYPLPYVGSEWSIATLSVQGQHQNGQPYEAGDWPLARTLQSAESVEDEAIDIQYPDGKRGSLLVSSVPVRDASGQMIAAVAAFWDVTARNRTAESLRESEERYRLLVDSALDYAIFTTDPEGNITSWNAGAERLLGWSENEALGRSAAMIFTPEDRAAGRPEREMQIACQEGRASDERPHLRKNGQRFWASGILTPLPRSNGTVRGYAKIMRDNTERMQSDERLQNALQESESIRASVESANLAKDEFISTVSHELRTPLNTIRLWSRMLGSGRVPHEDWGEGVGAIDRAALAQQQLIDDLLDVSRMASGHLRLTMRATRLREAIKGAIGAVQPSAEARKIRIETNLADDVGVVRADPDRIQQILWNLLTNAVKFTPSGGLIKVDLARVTDGVEVRVKDTGIGIKPDFLPYVFERFRQAELSTTRQHGGLGLGLAIVKQLVELHGGTVAVHSDGEGRGTIFVVTLPLKRDTDLGDEDPLSSTMEIERRLSGIDILLVEDDVATREATGRLLTLHGAKMRAVMAAAEALDEYSAKAPALMICDIGLPGEDGFALMEQIRAVERDRELPRVPAIALTAFASTADQRRALAAGFDKHLAKPVNIDALIAAITRLGPQEGVHSTGALTSL